MSKVAHDEDLVLAKSATVRECGRSIRSVWTRSESNLEAWIMRDVVVLNLQRSIQSLSDLAHHLVASNDWGLPASTGEAFDLLGAHSVLTPDQVSLARSMVGFRNISVHEYRRLDHDVVRPIGEKHLDEMEALATSMLAATVGA